jgi:hypothetical protein
MREKITILLLSAFLVSEIKAIPKDSVNYSFKAGAISPYSFKYSTNTRTYVWPFNSGISLGAEASCKNFTWEFSLDRSKFRRIDHKILNNSIDITRDIPFKLTQYRIILKNKIISSENSSLNAGVGLTLAYPSSGVQDKNDPDQGYYLYTGNGFCLNIDYTHKLVTDRLDLYAGLNYEQFIWNDESYSLGQYKSKYDLAISQDVPIYIIGLGLKYKIGRKKKQ